jgi:hypothetical protein
MSAREDQPTELEQRLAGWLPAAPALVRDQMLFEAGRASARAEARGKLWPCTALGLAILLVGMGGLFVHERSQRLALAARTTGPSVEIAVMPPRGMLPAPSDERPGPNSYFVLSRLSSEDLESPPASSRPGAEPVPERTGPQRPALGPRSFDRALDL